MESEVGYDAVPTKEMESNRLPIGTRIYKFRHADGMYIAVVTEKDETYYYRISELK